MDAVAKVLGVVPEEVVLCTASELVSDSVLSYRIDFVSGVTMRVFSSLRVLL